MFACVTTKFCLFRADINIVPLPTSADALADNGLYKITLSPLALKSVTVVLVALAVRVKDPVEFSLPSSSKFTALLTSLGVPPAWGRRRKLKLALSSS